MLDALCGIPDVEPSLFTPEWWTSVWGRNYGSPNWPRVGTNWPDATSKTSWPNVSNVVYNVVS